ncbi:endonuclease/exonuclease/phosphatase family protein [Halarchaeum acidiphilum MH1-52-1]|uniref:Endonuclease/exonuclease/phosphatase family protein n=1 Tax=Halarchaeum acidiphilum MH1-52-1 TaxID=1261545 RepID=U3AC29_9EURY|nr:endonuclease/exonuclease/phosphatase family protein [Halarchaeum acidiphilum]GAD52318.1 endonuclease/exonuclease/phosphatase family protein [Halarchaeum acidiphilum MH1-52-1]
MDSVRAMTYNVRVDTPEDGEDGWTYRRDAVAGTIRYHDPGVLGLQEPLAGQLADVRERLERYRFVGRSRGSGEGVGEHVPIGYDADRFALVDDETFWLSETPTVAGSVGWDGAHPRVCTRARLRERASGDELELYCVHLDHEGRTARERGAELVRERAAASAVPTIVLGDFNCEAGDPAHDVLTRTLRDARDIATYDHGPNTTRTDYRRLRPEWTIDHVLVSDAWTVDSRAACSDQYGDGRYPSDHLPVVVDLS